MAMPNRWIVQVGLTIHSAVEIPSWSSWRLHIALKFSYPVDALSIMGVDSAQIQQLKDKNVLRSYGTHQRCIPYTILNSLQEEPMSWTAQMTEDGSIFER